MVLTRLHRGLFAVQLGSRVDRCAQAVLVDELAHVLHLAAAKVNVVVAKVRNRKALFERQTVEKSADDHKLDFWASGGRPTVP